MVKLFKPVSGEIVDLGFDGLKLAMLALKVVVLVLPLMLFDDDDDGLFDGLVVENECSPIESSARSAHQCSRSNATKPFR